MKILKPNKPKPDYAEDSQSNSTQFAFVNKVEENLYELSSFPFKCRDFLGDALWSKAIKKPFAVYGFSYDPKTDKIDSDKTRIFLSKGTKGLLEDLSLLHDIETKLGFEKSQVIPVPKTQKCIVEGDSKWMHSSFTISLYTFLLKCFSYKVKYSDFKEKWFDVFIEKEQSNESRYLKATKDLKYNFSDLIKVVSKVVKFQPKTTHGWSQGADQYQIHHHSGWFSCVLNTQKFKSNKTTGNDLFDFTLKQLCQDS